MLRVQGLAFRAYGFRLEFKVRGLGFEVRGVGFGVIRDWFQIEIPWTPKVGKIITQNP